MATHNLIFSQVLKHLYCSQVSIRPFQHVVRYVPASALAGNGSISEAQGGFLQVSRQLCIG